VLSTCTVGHHTGIWNDQSPKGSARKWVFGYVMLLVWFCSWLVAWDVTMLPFTELNHWCFFLQGRPSVAKIILWNSCCEASGRDVSLAWSCWYWMTRNEPKWQYKQQVCTDETIQKKRECLAAWTQQWRTKVNDRRDARWTSRRELVD